MNTNEKKIVKKMLPQSHGSWAFVLEPLVLALWVAWSFNGLMLFIGALFAFLSHQPIRTLIAHGYQRTVFIVSFVIVSMAAFFILYFIVNTDVSINWRLFFAIFLLFIFLFIDLSGKAKSLVGELIVPFAISIMAASIFLVQKQSIVLSFAFLLVLLSRSLPTVFLVRTQIRVFKNKRYSNIPPIFAHLIALVIVIVLIYFNLIPPGIVIAVILLFLRCCIFLYPMKNKLSVKQIGISEFIFGMLFVVICGIAYTM
ncbi:MAG: hypothetical protein B6D61_13055 [Bacteroidetes bacterium 4484_249]|nr:MAG: hypothetical protein B6D61_13055 [Bacteroidetes bacterium 4484_249]